MVRLPGAHNWLKSPQDRKIIGAWTVGRGEGMTYALDVPPPADPERFTFLALGDTGDSEASGPHVSPQDAVAREMARDAALPGSAGQAALVLHTGDVVYMTGERRLYDRNFRQPYAPFLSPQSTVDSMVFRLPFLPVPGNHDYYDLKGWTRWLTHVPLLGAGVRAIAHELFAFSLPYGGSEMGKAYMDAFVDPAADTRHQALPYRPGERTQLPNRYYRFRIGNTDFFALDSNTLDAPAPWKETAHLQAEATQRIQVLEERAQELDGELRRHQLVLDHWRDAAQHEVVRDTDRQANIIQLGAEVGSALTELRAAIASASQALLPCGEAAQALEKALNRWTAAANDFAAATEPETLLAALQTLDSASDECCTALAATDSCLAVLPEGADRAQILAAHDSSQVLLHRWSQAVATAPLETAQRIHQLSEEALDVQRELALERRRLHYGPEDFDGAQRQWLESSLAEAIRERPNGWRIVYLHHPLYTTISNHCERPDVQGLRENLQAIFQGRVHLILSGHAHAFEWFRSEALPDTGIFVTGGGGQVALRPTLLEPARLQRSRHRYEALRANGVQECAIAGRGPAAADGEAGLLYHYLRIEVTPDVLTVRPVGIRRLPDGYRREEPMPVYHVPELPELRPALNPRYLEAIEIRRHQPPRPRWL
jgi:hypothetical protein